MAVTLALAVDPKRALGANLVALLPEVARWTLAVTGYPVTPANPEVGRIISDESKNLDRHSSTGGICRVADATKGTRLAGSGLPRLARISHPGGVE